MVKTKKVSAKIWLHSAYDAASKKSPGIAVDIELKNTRVFLMLKMLRFIEKSLKAPDIWVTMSIATEGNDEYKPFSKMGIFSTLAKYLGKFVDSK